MVYQHSHLNSPSTDSFGFPPLPLFRERDSLFFFRLIRSFEMEISQFSETFNHFFPLDNNVLILGLVIEKPTLSLLLDTTFSVLFHQLCRCRGGISVTRADNQITETIMY